MSIHSARAKSWLVSILLAFVAFAPGWAAADGHHRPFDRLVIFGDSLSDPGNAFALNGGQTISPPDYGMSGVTNGIPDVISLIPDAPYSSRRFSNGRTWIEDFAAAVGLPQNARPAVAGALFGEDDGRASNYAVGGATAADLRASGGSQFPLSVQVNLFLTDVRGSAPADALYVVEIGGNDIRAALAAAQAHQDPTVVIAAALKSVADNVGKLYGAGARHFLVWSAPDVGRTPALRRLDTFVAPGIAAGATTLSGLYNQGLAGALQGLGAALPGITIVPFDAFNLLKDVQTNPRRFGLIDATNACIQPDVPAFGFPSSPPFRCARPDGFFFWDGIHPTRAGHAVIAIEVGKTLIGAVLQDL
ncbi:MAG TPA: SGNH/GDSL hydrolase family protein [Burkholderiales bacterium]|jgi:outer membrane lipase/esterase